MAVLFLSANPKFTFNRLYIKGYALLGDGLIVDDYTPTRLFFHWTAAPVVFDFAIFPTFSSARSNSYTLDHVFDLDNSFIYLSGVVVPFGTFIDWGYDPVDLAPVILVRPVPTATMYQILPLPPPSSPWYVPHG